MKGLGLEECFWRLGHSIFSLQTSQMVDLVYFAFVMIHPPSIKNKKLVRPTPPLYHHPHVPHTQATAEESSSRLYTCTGEVHRVWFQGRMNFCHVVPARNTGIDICTGMLLVYSSMRSSPNCLHQTKKLAVALRSLSHHCI